MRIMFSLKGGYYGKKGYFQDDSEGAKEDKVRAMDVVVEERIDGSMLITHKDRILKYKEINKSTKAKDERKPHVLTVRKTYKPSADHP